MPLFKSVNVHTNSYVCILKYIQPTTTIDKVKKWKVPNKYSSEYSSINKYIHTLIYTDLYMYNCAYRYSTNRKLFNFLSIHWEVLPAADVLICCCHFFVQQLL